MHPTRFDFSHLQSVVFGAAAEDSLPAWLDEHAGQRVLLVGSASLADASNHYASLRAALGHRLAGVHTGIRAHTPRQDVLRLLSKARECGADILLSVGGGSVIDACKVVQLALAHGLYEEAELLDFAQRSGQRGSRAGEPLPDGITQLSVPTTLSGAEFSNNAGVLDAERQSKEGYRAVGLCPRAVFYDPLLAQHTPDWLWLSTAIRSLDHAIEGYCSADCHPYLEAHFLHAMRLFAESLPAVAADSTDLAARSLNQQAVWLACCGLGTVAHGASHGIGYVLGSLCAVPHGYTSCVMLPAVLEWNATKMHSRQAAIAEALGMPGKTAAQAVRELVARLNLPTSLEQVNVPESQFDQIARRACEHPVVRKNPVPITSPRQVREILELARG
jgi:maleylacetate reductase